MGVMRDEFGDMRVGDGGRAGVAAYPGGSPGPRIAQGQQSPYQYQQPLMPAQAQPQLQHSTAYYVQPPSGMSAPPQQLERKVPAMGIEDDICAMGFSRDQVRSTIHDLAQQNPGAPLDLNAVLDRLQRAPPAAPSARW